MKHNIYKAKEAIKTLQANTLLEARTLTDILKNILWSNKETKY